METVSEATGINEDPISPDDPGFELIGGHAMVSGLV